MIRVYPPGVEYRNMVGYYITENQDRARRWERGEEAPPERSFIGPDYSMPEYRYPETIYAYRPEPEENEWGVVCP